MRPIQGIAALGILVGLIGFAAAGGFLSVAADASPTPSPSPTATSTPIPVGAIEDVPIGLAVKMVTEASEEEAVRLFELMSVRRAADILDLLDAQVGGPVFEGLGLLRAAELMAEMDFVKASAVMDELTTDRGVGLIGSMDLARSAEIWSRMEPVKAGAVFDEVPVEWTTEVIKAVPEDRLIARLPEASTIKLWEVPLQTLMDNLPSVPVMHLDFWNRPEVDPALRPAEREELSPLTAVYTLPEAREAEWALLVGSPLPVERLWVRFNRPLSNVRTIVEQLSQRPPNTVELPPGRVPNTFLNLKLENANPADISIAAAIVSVEKSWLSANQLHKWSVQFNRFDEALRAWVPFPTKRIREDEERISFAVVLPGFSTLAITGSAELPEQTFKVDDLSISPESPRAGDDITIGARATNIGPQEAVYAANL